MFNRPTAMCPGSWRGLRRSGSGGAVPDIVAIRSARTVVAHRWRERSGRLSRDVHLGAGPAEEPSRQHSIRTGDACHAGGTYWAGAESGVLIAATLRSSADSKELHGSGVAGHGTFTKLLIFAALKRGIRGNHLHCQLSCPVE